MTRWSANTRTRTRRSTLAHDSHSTTGAEEKTSTGSYTTSGDATLGEATATRHVDAFKPRTSHDPGHGRTRRTRADPATERRVAESKPHSACSTGHGAGGADQHDVVAALVVVSHPGFRGDRFDWFPLFIRRAVSSPYLLACCASNSPGGMPPSEVWRRSVLNQATYSTIASSSCEVVFQTRSRISSVLKLSTKLSASALSGYEMRV